MLLFWVALLCSGALSRASSLDNLDCKNIKAHNFIYDLSGINFPVNIQNEAITPPTKTTTSIDINLCEDLEPGIGPVEEQCPKGTRICMKIINDKPGKGERVTQVIPTAGGGEEGAGTWYATLGEHIGVERILEMEFYGGDYAEHKQRTKIKLRCDKDVSKDNKPSVKKYDREDGELHLEWRTPNACAKHIGGAGDHDDENDQKQPDEVTRQSGGWGVFSWFLFFILILAAVYLGAGLWRNYNEYGVIELPNRDFWREAPYIAKDMGKHIYSTVSGQGTSRGAYEPV